MKPAAPGTSIRMRARVGSGLLARLRALAPRFERRVDFRPVRLQRLGAVEVRLRLVAAAELEEGVAEVVVRIALGEVARSGTAKRRDRLLEQGERLRVAPLLHEPPCAVVQRV